MKVEHAAIRCSEPGCSFSVDGAGGAAAHEVRRQLDEHMRLVHASPLRLNLGAGDDRREGFVSVDLRSDVADVKASVDELPYETGAVDELLALDILEHALPDEVPAVLAEWRRVLRVGGRLTVRVPNMLALAQQIVSGLHIEDSIVNIYGGHRWGVRGSLDCHHAGWTPPLLNEELHRAGFLVISNDTRVNMTVVCERQS